MPFRFGPQISKKLISLTRPFGLDGWWKLKPFCFVPGKAEKRCQLLRMFDAVPGSLPLRPGDVPPCAQIHGEAS